MVHAARIVEHDSMVVQAARQQGPELRLRGRVNSKSFNTYLQAAIRTKNDATLI